MRDTEEEMPGLHKAALEERIDEVVAIIDSGEDPDLRDAYGWTALHLAAELCHEDVCETLILNGADVNARDETGETPLHKAASGNCLAVCRILLDHDANPLAEDDTGRTADDLTADLDIADVIAERRLAALEREKIDTPEVKAGTGGKTGKPRV